MTRKEQILQEADNYIKGKSLVQSTTMGLCKSAFIEGANWADKNVNLESLWHNAEEEPEEANWLILCFDEKDNCWLYSKYHMSFDNDELGRTGWKDFINYELVTKWAYVKDLVPKKN